MDAIVRPSHRQPNGHRPSVRLSSIVPVTTLGIDGKSNIDLLHLYYLCYVLLNYFD
jgi:hypothetical protein